ncbi:MAG: site-specific integrase [Planctomycetia bacterium]|nr:site-specific integrase [Planctomycetia bacterium]
MSKTAPRIPSYRRHRPSGLGVVTLPGRGDVYLGQWNSANSRAEYNRLIGEWTASGGTLAPSHDLTVVELAAAFLKHAKGYYKRPDGQFTGEVANYKTLIRRLSALYGRTAANQFGPLALKTVRQQLIDACLARKTINQAVNRVRHIFKWGCENQLIEPSVLQGLQAVAGLRYGRSGAKETAPVRCVPDCFVDAVLPYVSPQVGAMIELQRASGMRSGEVCSMRGCDINTSGKVWVYTVGQHKTAWHGHQRQVFLGPRAQQILRPFLKADLQAPLFSPRESLLRIHEARHARRVTPLAWGNRPGSNRVRKPKKAAGDAYTAHSYQRAVTYGIQAANRARLAEAKAELIPHWHPHQLRHNYATRVRREHGLETARILLGHRSVVVSELYAEVDNTKAVLVAAKIG